MAYSQKVVKRFEDVLKNPEAHNVGRFDPNDPDIGTGMVGAPACGDVMRLQLQVTDNVITDIRFKTYGCGSAIASSSELIDMLTGKTLEQAEDITNKDIANALSLPPIKLHCSVLAEESIEQAIADYRRKDNYRRSDHG
jgi:nitrogen fixation NifU-like protein|tara:strand:+ start:1410 stop:1826 length:417 start_codon:yes stop_codon:yes gene_type:complete